MRAMKRRALALLAVVAAGLVLWLSSFVLEYDRWLIKADPLSRPDVARLLPAKVGRVERIHDVEQMKALLGEAKQKNLKVSIAGSRHSQGGQTYTDDALVFDMKGFNQILALDEKAKTLTAQAGATWDDVQHYVNPRRLAVKVMQSSYVFTLGGTLSANAHGRDLATTSVVETVESFHLLRADGTLVNVSRTDNPELFSLVIGGYGLFGVIVDVTIHLADDDLYERRAAIIDYREFPAYFAKNVQGDPDAVLMLVRPSIDPDDFLREFVVTTWNRTTRAEPADIHTLGEEEGVLQSKLAFNLSRSYDWAKTLRWKLQKQVESSPGQTKLITRNNSMRPPETPLAFLDYYAKDRTDIIQEYYVPTRNFVSFMDTFRRILVDGKMDVISSTIRFVKKNDETVLAYAPSEDCFAIIQMSNVGLSSREQEHAAKVTQDLVEAAIQNGGSYYLTYQSYPTPGQMRRAYPRTDFAFERKRHYDPDERFSSRFYERYAKVAH
jgi:decaprenylphospho-beta-D-ribofuranose 2-oxidase